MEIIMTAFNSKKYTKEEFIEAVSIATSMANMLTILGLNPTGGNYSSSYKKIKDLKLDNSHWTGQGWSKDKILGPKKNIEDYLIKNDFGKKSSELKKRLVKENLMEDKCIECGTGVLWNDKPITLHLDHINGDNSDNRLENLRILCPNCHSQTSNFGSKNRGKYKERAIANKIKAKENAYTSSETRSQIDKANRFKTSSLLSPEMINISKEELQELMWIKPLNFVAEKLSLNVKRLREYCREIGLNVPHKEYWSEVSQKTKIIWPSKEDLEKLVWETPRSILAKTLGVSDKAIAKRCDKLGIIQPARGYWMKLNSVKDL